MTDESTRRLASLYLDRVGLLAPLHRAMFLRDMVTLVITLDEEALIDECLNHWEEETKRFGHTMLSIEEIEELSRGN